MAELLPPEVNTRGGATRHADSAWRFLAPGTDPGVCLVLDEKLPFRADPLHNAVARLALYGAEQRMVFGANTYRAFARMLVSSTEAPEVLDPWVFQGAADFDLELLESRTLDGHIQELVYRPTLH